VHQAVRTALRSLSSVVDVAATQAAAAAPSPVRLNQMRLLGVVGGDAAVAPLTLALKDKDAAVRVTAVRALLDVAAPARDKALAAVREGVRVERDERTKRQIESLLKSESL
jgi:HEAT repeat protein